MADNRLYLKCAVCGCGLFIGKSHFNGAFYANYSPDEGTLEEKLNKFYSDHMHIDDPQNYNLLGTNFYIEHECDTDGLNEILQHLYSIKR